MDLSKLLGGGQETKEERMDEKATDLLENDHDAVKALFEQFRAAKDEGDSRKKRRLYEQIDRELTVHSTIEEEVFYPAVKREGGEAVELTLEAREEHAVVKSILGQLRGQQPGDATFDAKMKVLMESVEHHIDEEEGDMFPEARKLGDDELRRLGAELATRKEQLKHGAAAPRGTAAEPASPRSSRRPPAKRSERTRTRKAPAKNAAQRARARSTRARSSKKATSARGSRKSAKPGRSPARAR
jgi:hemerythrin superfamily protein